jgi:hypothetical protein
MRRILYILSLLVALTAFSAPAFAAGGATFEPNAIWVNNTLYSTVATPNSLPNHGPFNPIYAFTNATSTQRSIAQFAPGDVGYVGGRWEVHLVTFTGTQPPEIKSYAQLLQYEMNGTVTIDNSVAKRFVCTLVPAR